MSLSNFFKSLIRREPEEPKESIELASSNAGMSNSEFSALVNQAFGDYDSTRYGMPISKLKGFSDDPKKQEEFKKEFGIDYHEYMTRLAMGEQMGESMVNGKFVSLNDAR